MSNEVSYSELGIVLVTSANPSRLLAGTSIPSDIVAIMPAPSASCALAMGLRAREE